MGIVSESLAECLQWSYWYPCWPEQKLIFVPDVAGICVLARAQGSGAGLSIEYAEAAYDLDYSLQRVLSPGSPIFSELHQGQWFLRYVPIAERSVRSKVLYVIQKWMHGATPAATRPALIEEMLAPKFWETSQ